MNRLDTRQRLSAVIAKAQSEGLVTDTTVPVAEERPWPVVLLTAFGAWLAAVPLCAFLALLLDVPLRSGVGPYLVGGVSLAGAAYVLRAKRVALFVEQLAVPWLLAGGSLVAFGFFRDLPFRGGTLAMALLAVAVAVAVPRAWLRACLGAAAAVFVGLTLAAKGGAAQGWWALQGLLAVAVVAMAREDRCRPAWAGGFEAALPGWLAATLAGLASWSGWTFMAGSMAPGVLGGAPTPVQAGLHGLSALFAAAGLVLLARRWPSLRRPVLAVAAIAVIGLAGTMAALGSVLLAAAVCAVTGRWRLLGLAAVAATWIVGAFYYQLDWRLVDKAGLLAAAAVVFGAVAWRLGAPWPARARAADVSGGRFALPTVLIFVATVLALAVANVGIARKEALIAHGRTVLVELAPVDPRSLMQGDYMRLNFRLPEAPTTPPGPGELAP
ncbi:MAG: GDYXXLXY domain-containing protein, partial [Rhizobacter sp.]